jgi:hypothetical protein
LFCFRGFAFGWESTEIKILVAHYTTDASIFFPKTLRSAHAVARLVARLVGPRKVGGGVPSRIMGLFGGGRSAEHGDADDNEVLFSGGSTVRLHHPVATSGANGDEETAKRCVRRGSRAVEALLV